MAEKQRENILAKAEELLTGVETITRPMAEIPMPGELLNRYYADVAKTNRLKDTARHVAMVILDSRMNKSPTELGIGDTYYYYNLVAKAVQIAEIINYEIARQCPPPAIPEELLPHLPHTAFNPE